MAERDVERPHQRRHGAGQRPHGQQRADHDHHDAAAAGLVVTRLSVSSEEDAHDRDPRSTKPDAGRHRDERDQAEREREVLLERLAVGLERLPGEQRQDRRSRSRRRSRRGPVPSAGWRSRGARRSRCPGPPRSAWTTTVLTVLMPYANRRGAMSRRRSGRPGSLQPSAGRHRAQATQLRDLDRDLEQAADEDAGREAVRRLRQVRRDEQRGQDQRDVQEDRSRRGQREAAVGVQDRLAERGQRDEEDVGKEPAVEDTVSSNLPGSRGTARPAARRARARRGSRHRQHRQDIAASGLWRGCAPPAT